MQRQAGGDQLGLEAAEHVGLSLFVTDEIDDEKRARAIARQQVWGSRAPIGIDGSDVGIVFEARDHLEERAHRLGVFHGAVRRGVQRQDVACARAQLLLNRQIRLPTLARRVFVAADLEARQHRRCQVQADRKQHRVGQEDGLAVSDDEAGQGREHVGADYSAVRR